jgi:hypothetical protein
MMRTSNLRRAPPSIRIANAEREVKFAVRSSILERVQIERQNVGGPDDVGGHPWVDRFHEEGVPTTDWDRLAGWRVPENRWVSEDDTSEPGPARRDSLGEGMELC